MRRAPAKSWEHLKDASLLAMDDRIAAEIVLRFYEDLALRGQAEPLPDLSTTMAWHPLHERLSNHPETLDEDLVRLGISPHPRVVLQGLNCQDFDDVGVARRVVVTGRAAGATAEL